MKSSKVRNLLLSIILHAFTAQLLWGVMPASSAESAEVSLGRSTFTHQTDQHKVVASEILGVAESEEDALSDEEEEHELNSFVPFSVTTFNETLEHTWSYFDSNDRFFACTSGKDKCIAFQCFRC